MSEEVAIGVAGALPLACVGGGDIISIDASRTFFEGGGSTISKSGERRRLDVCAVAEESEGALLDWEGPGLVGLSLVDDFFLAT